MVQVGTWMYGNGEEQQFTDLAYIYSRSNTTQIEHFCSQLPFWEQGNEWISMASM